MLGGLLLCLALLLSSLAAESLVVPQSGVVLRCASGGHGALGWACFVFCFVLLSELFPRFVFGSSTRSTTGRSRSETVGERRREKEINNMKELI